MPDKGGLPPFLIRGEMWNKCSDNSPYTLRAGAECGRFRAESGRGRGQGRRGAERSWFCSGPSGSLQLCFSGARPPRVAGFGSSPPPAPFPLRWRWSGLVAGSLPGSGAAGGSPPKAAASLSSGPRGSFCFIRVFSAAGYPGRRRGGTGIRPPGGRAPGGCIACGALLWSDWWRSPSACPLPAGC